MTAPGGAADQESGAGRPGIGPADRYGLLLFLLVFTYVLSAFVSGVWVSAMQVVLFMGVLLLALRTGRLGRRASRLAAATVVSGSLITLAVSLALGTDQARAAADLWTALVLLLAVGMIVSRVLAHDVITLQSILGAVSAYMIIGLMFASIYRSVDLLGSGSFFLAGDPPAARGDQGVSTYQYFSFTTLTTLGYGDYTAAGNGGRAVAVIEALGGQIFLATLVARLVAGFRPPARPAASGALVRRDRHRGPGTSAR